MSNKRNEQLARHLANNILMNGMLQSMSAEADAEMLARRECYRIENERREKEYRQSMEFKLKRAKKKADRKLRKKSQGR